MEVILDVVGGPGNPTVSLPPEPHLGGRRLNPVTRSWPAACAGLLLLAACASEPLNCDVCSGPGAFVNVEGRMPSLPFTVRVCVVDLDIPCAEATYEQCRPGKSCTYSLDDSPPPGASRPGWVSLSTITLDLGDVEPEVVDGHRVSVTIDGPSDTKTRTADFDYYAGGECCGDQSFADVQFRFTRSDDHSKS